MGFSTTKVSATNLLEGSTTFAFLDGQDINSKSVGCDIYLCKPETEEMILVWLPALRRLPEYDFCIHFNGFVIKYI